MQLIKKITLLVAYCLIGYGVQAQAKQADSIYDLIQSSRNPDQRLRLVIDYCGAYRTYPYDTLRKYAAYAVTLAQELNDEKSIREGLYYMALYYYEINRLDVAQRYLGTINTAGGKENFTGTFRNKLDLLKASVALRENNLASALSSFYNIMARAERQQDSIGYLTALAGIGWSYLELGNVKEAKAWSLKGIGLKLSDNMMRYALHFYNNIIPCYGMEERMDSAKYYTDKALLLADKYGDLLLKANVLNFRANLYTANKEYDKAIAAMTDAVHIRKYINDPFYIVSDMATLSYIYDAAGHPDKGIETAKEGLRIANKNRIDAKLPILYRSLYCSYTEKKDYKQASEVLLKLSDLKDSLYQKASAKSIAEMEVKYQTAAKEKIIQRQQFALIRKNYWLYGSLVLLMLIVLMVIIGYRSYRNKQKLNIQQLYLKQQIVLTQSILQAEENERKRIAADLHDGLGQMLTAAKYNMAGIADDMQYCDENKRSIFNKASALIDDSCKEVRAISHNIMPNSLLANGFTAAVKNFLEKAGQEKLVVNFNTTGIDKEVNTNTQVILYRIIQECVHNVIKHAAASQLDISVMNDASGISVSVEDDGKGFNLYDADHANGIGLKSIRTRTEYLQGKLEIDTQPGKGTLISIHIPPVAA